MDKPDVAGRRGVAEVTGDGEFGPTAERHTVQASDDRRRKEANGVQRSLSVTREGLGLFLTPVAGELGQIPPDAKALSPAPVITATLILASSYASVNIPRRRSRTPSESGLRFSARSISTNKTPSS